MKPDDFIAQLAPAAVASAKVTGIPASFVVAQAALESGWGTAKPAVNALNLFNIKADASWTGAAWQMASQEYVAGRTVLVPAKWRMYPSWQASVEDHAAFLKKNKRYAACFAPPDWTSPAGRQLLVKCGNSAALARPAWFAMQIAAAGYATDPAYLDKVLQVLRGHNLIGLDSQR
ncbi:glycoside hydrolase family 73 protein [Duganella callida]|uniref:Mannosyl-glycoprotein endo-beta-N-acetylglucosamidase n=1 Tax=Duganella callida TaxID=2561932 RepID=A0A4Y9SDM8_9BURK|nr:glucosaminidase domain-containing protein [Duganella callida]TFW17974.1 mannosyl-glycoprotein endo-beta-N-acetylglucosamidase [Duganella callida]